MWRKPALDWFCGGECKSPLLRKKQEFPAARLRLSCLPRFAREADAEPENPDMTAPLKGNGTEPNKEARPARKHQRKLATARISP
jgi:hypothetical protein